MEDDAPLTKGIAVSVTAKLIILALIGGLWLAGIGQHFYALLCLLASIIAAALCYLAYFKVNK